MSTFVLYCRNLPHGAQLEAAPHTPSTSLLGSRTARPRPLWQSSNMSRKRHESNPARQARGGDPASNFQGHDMELGSQVDTLRKPLKLISGSESGSC
jgi:hypothetical protein